MPSHARITTLAAVFYIPLSLIAFVWAWLSDRRAPWTFDAQWMSGSFAARLGLSLILGVVLAAVVVVFTRTLVRRARWAQGLHRELKPLVEDLSTKEVAWLALSSGLAEELFFRGAMQPTLGLWLTSLIFGVVHVGPKRVFLAWTLWAFAMGVLLGAMFEWTGVLWGSVLAHVSINFFNMRFIQRH